MTLQDFDKILSAKEIKKGQDYFANGQVIDLEEWEKGSWNATVCGTEDYEVEVALKKEAIIHVECTCPVEDDYCKHVIATLFAIREETGGKTKADKKASKRSTAKETFADIVNRTTEKELRSFVIDYAARNREFRSLFLVQFSGKSSKRGKEAYAPIIQQAAKGVIGRGGYVSDATIAKAIKPVDAILDKGNDAIGKHHFGDAADIAFAIIENLHYAVVSLDGEEGNIESRIHLGFVLLFELCKAEIPFDLKARIFHHSFCEAADPKYGGYIYHWLVALELTAFDHEKKEQVVQFLDTILKQVNAKTDSWEKENEIQLLVNHKMKMLKGLDRIHEADALHLQYLYIHEFRIRAIEEALDKKDYAAAAKHINEGIEIEKAKRFGRNEEGFMKLKLRLAREQGDLTFYRKTAKELYDKHYQDIAYYRMIKNSYPAEEWPAQAGIFVQELEQILSVQPSYLSSNNTSKLADLFVEEKYWDRLLKLLQKNISLEFLERYSHLLIPQFTSELLVLYETALINYAENSMGRDYYFTIMTIMEKIQKWEGGQTVVKRLYNLFKEKYYKRRAMMDELKKLKIP